MVENDKLLSEADELLSEDKKSLASKPNIKFLFLVAALPYATLFGYTSALSGFTWLADKFGFFLPSVVPVPVLCAPYWLIPLGVFCYMWKKYAWFCKACPLVLLWWCLCFPVTGFTQGALSEYSWRAMGRPISSSLAYAESSVPGLYYPRRCQLTLNELASEILRAMDEVMLSEPVNPHFLFRLLVLEENNRPICYRVNLTGNDSATLCVKTLAREPISSYASKPKYYDRDKPLTKMISLAAPVVATIRNDIQDAKKFYDKNCFKSTGFGRGRKQYFIEFSSSGHYFFYAVPESVVLQSFTDPTSHALPAFLIDILRICEESRDASTHIGS